MKTTVASKPPISGNLFFEAAKRRAGKTISRRLRLFRLIRKASRKLRRHENILGALHRDVALLIRLCTAWGRREYRRIPWRSVLYLAAALVYFVMPFDLVPDLLPGLGFVDDAAVVSGVVRSLQHELDQFARWDSRRNPRRLQAID